MGSEVHRAPAVHGPHRSATRVIRGLNLAIQIPGVLKLAEPLAVWEFRKDNVRVLAELKRYVEAQPKQRPPSNSDGGHSAEVLGPPMPANGSFGGEPERRDRL
jgi:hypothetical protein